MKVAIIMTDSLPVPAVKGGAVQTGVQQLIDINEEQKQIEITILCVKDENAILESKKYESSKFIFLKSSKLLNMRIINQVNKFLKFVNIKNVFYKNQRYLNGIRHALKQNEYDYVLLQNACNLVIPLRKTVKNNLFLHLHSDFLHKNILNSREIEKCCDKIIVVSEFIKRRVLTIEGAEESKIIINKNCTDSKQFDRIEAEKNPKTTNFAKLYNISKDDIVILFSGRPIKDKGIEELILAVKKINIKNIKLLVVGSKGFGAILEDNYLEYLKELSSSMGNHIIFTGFIPYEDLQYIHALSHIAVIPSLLEEPAGRVVVEAQLSSLPVIVTDSGGISEYTTINSAIVVKRDNNLVEQISNELIRLIQDKSLREIMGKNGRLFAEELSPQRYYKEFVDFFSL